MYLRLGKLVVRCGFDLIYWWDS